MQTKFMSMILSSGVRVGVGSVLAMLLRSMVTGTEEEVTISQPPLISWPQEVITFVKLMRSNARKQYFHSYQMLSPVGVAAPGSSLPLAKPRSFILGSSVSQLEIQGQISLLRNPQTCKADVCGPRHMVGWLVVCLQGGYRVIGCCWPIICPVICSFTQDWSKFPFLEHVL